MGLYLIVTGDFVTTGGMDRANHALASYLARRGDEVHLVAHRVANDLLAFPNVVFHQVPKPAGSYLLAEPLLDRIGRYWAKQISARGGRVVVNGGNCQWGDVNWVHYVHAAYTPQPAGNLALRLRAALHRRTSLQAEHTIVNRARLVIANSDLSRRHLIGHVGVADRLLRTVYYGSDAVVPTDGCKRLEIREELGWSVNEPIIVFVGAVSDRRKGFDVLYEAWVRMCGDKRWKGRLVVIGSGSEAPAWKAKAERDKLNGRIDFLGFRADVPRLLGAADLQVAPTRYEAYGLAVHEAICAGIPTLVSSNAGVTERFPAALLDMQLPVPPEPTSVARQLWYWHARHDQCSTLARETGRQFRAFTWDDMARTIIDEIEVTPRVRGW